MKMLPEIIYYTLAACKYQCKSDAFNGVRKHKQAPEFICHAAELEQKLKRADVI